ncbi:glycerol kinase GlpK [Tsukamurella soli]|uniref:ATP:glycerol 3-phosphotransferase n=1 Tax=Tsukamurella soli TaxID=644556 RepID=A0ABP8JMS7_9ACTN
MTESYVAALDQGTTSTRCMLFGRDGRMVALSQQAHRRFFPRPGWVEHDAMEIWETVRRVLPQALSDAGVQPAQVVGLGITNQRETVVVWDRRTGRPVHNAIVWQDSRTDELLPTIAEEISDEQIHDLSGLRLASYFSGPKLRWLLEHDDSIRSRAEAGELLVGTMDSWLVWNLTGGVHGGLHVTDATNASRTMLMNIETLAWDARLTAAMRVPRAALPEIRPSIGLVGHTVDPIGGIPITAIMGDQQASLFGQAGFDPGAAKCTFGTGGFLLLNTGTEPLRSRHGLVTTVAQTTAGEPPVYALEGSIAVAGALVQWCHDNLGLIRSPAEIETLARTVDDAGGCIVVPAFTGMYSPHWVSGTRGLMVGVSSYVTKAHICRAVLDATAWQIREIVDAMNADAEVPLTHLAVDGGMTADNLLMQIIADVLAVPVVRPMVAETVSLGAAYAAGLGAGFWPDHSMFRRNWHRAAEWHPMMSDSAREAGMADWRRAVRLAIAWGESAND